MVQQRVRRVTLAISALLLGGCSRGPEPCRQLKHCGEGYECLAQRCVSLGSDPVPQDAARLVLEPTRIGVLSKDETPRLGGVRLHAPDGSQSELLLDFPLPDGDVSLVTAFLVVSAVDLPTSNRGFVRLRVSRVVDPWTAEGLANGHSPQHGYESASGLMSGAQATRVDVTELLRPWLQRSEPGFGLVLSSPDPSPLVLALEGRTVEPFLELYTKAKGTRN